jgi:hypothetical protein
MGSLLPQDTKFWGKVVGYFFLTLVGCLMALHGHSWAHSAKKTESGSTTAVGLEQFRQQQQQLLGIGIIENPANREPEAKDATQAAPPKALAAPSAQACIAASPAASKTCNDKFLSLRESAGTTAAFVWCDSPQSGCSVQQKSTETPCLSLRDGIAQLKQIPVAEFAAAETDSTKKAVLTTKLAKLVLTVGLVHDIAERGAQLYGTEAAAYQLPKSVRGDVGKPVSDVHGKPVGLYQVRAILAASPPSHRPHLHSHTDGGKDDGGCCHAMPASCVWRAQTDEMCLCSRLARPLASWHVQCK